MTKIIDKPVAKINPEDIEKIISRNFSSDRIKGVMALLQEYKGETEAGRLRVWAAILKLSNGDIDNLKKDVKRAIFDYRDIIAFAEYPEYSEKVGFNLDKFGAETLKKIIKRDWEQYNNWLKRK